MSKNSLSLSVVVCLVFVFCFCLVLFFRVQGNDLETKLLKEYISCCLLAGAVHGSNVCSYVRQVPLFLRLSMHYCRTHRSSFELKHVIGLW